MAENDELAEAIRELRDEVRELREQASGEQVTPRERLRLAYRDEPGREPEGDAA